MHLLKYARISIQYWKVLLKENEKPLGTQRTFLIPTKIRQMTR